MAILDSNVYTLSTLIIDFFGKKPSTKLLFEISIHVCARFDVIAITIISLLDAL